MDNKTLNGRKKDNKRKLQQNLNDIRTESVDLMSHFI